MEVLVLVLVLTKKSYLQDWYDYSKGKSIIHIAVMTLLTMGPADCVHPIAYATPPGQNLRRIIIIAKVCKHVNPANVF